MVFIHITRKANDKLTRYCLQTNIGSHQTKDWICGLNKHKYICVPSVSLYWTSVVFCFFLCPSIWFFSLNKNKKKEIRRRRSDLLVSPHRNHFVGKEGNVGNGEPYSIDVLLICSSQMKAADGLISLYKYIYFYSPWWTERNWFCVSFAGHYESTGRELLCSLNIRAMVYDFKFWFLVQEDYKIEYFQW